MKYAIKTDKGKYRNENQDCASISFLNNWTLAILCDGMGGHFGGALCSQKTVELLVSYFQESFNDNIQFNDRKNINKWFNTTLSYIKKSLKDIVNSKNIVNYQDMGTTLTAALVFNLNKQTYVFNIGDSRTYAYNGLLHQITIDQNVLHELAEIKKIDMDIVKLLPDANKLVSCLGPNKNMKCDSFLLKSSEEIKYILLTSDGIHDFVDKPTIEQILLDKKLNLDKKAQKLIDIAKKNQSRDNLTALILEL
ncbi:PP2C family protein-serine/threonine phosphatase [Mycoplasma sp. 332]|uniref:PP2C family protein-serine/threonine phosphatase n=1 Tax=Mycoplasma sp. 332 TaxID=3458236 RepID=UPI004036EFAB